MKFSLFLFLLGCFISFSTLAESELEIAKRMCDKMDGQTEVILKSKSRCDCMTDSVVVEVDWAAKWKEGLGQALHYSAITGKTGVLALILKKKSDARYVKLARATILYHNLDIAVTVINSAEVR